jgi:VWFA-related protein
VDVNLVDILATVRDRDGGIVSDLTKDDFILEENGKLQEIRYFSRQTELPLTIGLLIDTSMSQRRLIDRERRASYQFFEQVLRPEQDMAFVIKFDVEVELLQDLTNSRHLLETALNLLQVPGSYPGPTGGGGRSRWQGRPGGQRWPGLYDSVFLAADELLRQQAGRKAIILISDGVDFGSKVSQNDAIEAAQRADTIVYGVRYYDPSAYQRQRGRGGPSRISNSSGKKTLNTISTETGGRMFEVADKLTLEKIFDQIQEELRNQYSIGYTPSDLTGDNLRQVKLRTRDKKLKVQTRAGYYPKPL